MSHEGFFHFLQFAIGTRHDAPQLSEESWQCMFAQCKRHALLGIGYRAVERCHAQGQHCPKGLLFQWAMLSEQIKQRNAQLTAESRRLTEQLDADGFDACVLKGQGNLLYYPEELQQLRQSGDIDLWVHPRGESQPVSRTIAYAQQQAQQPLEICYHHLHSTLSDITNAELHYRPSFSFVPWRNARLQRWFRSHRDSCMQVAKSEGFARPTLAFNRVYQLSHIYRHFIASGIGLRQLMDYYFLLQHCAQAQSQPSTALPSLENDLKSQGLHNFARGLMWCLAEVFEGKHEAQAWAFVPEQANTGRLILSEVLNDGNFGQYHPHLALEPRLSRWQHEWHKLRRQLHFFRAEPTELLFVLPFRVWHYCWRNFRWWRY